MQDFLKADMIHQAPWVECDSSCQILNLRYASQKYLKIKGSKWKWKCDRKYPFYRKIYLSNLNFSIRIIKKKSCEYFCCIMMMLMTALNESFFTFYVFFFGYCIKRHFKTINFNLLMYTNIFITNSCNVR